MKEIHTLFGGEVRVKLIRFFLFNPAHAFTLPNLQDRIQAPTTLVRKELTVLERGGFLRKKSGMASSGAKGRKKRMPHWHLDAAFPYTDALHTFFTSTTELNDKHLVTKIGRTGKIRLIVISGAFVKNWDSRLDILIVGDEVRQASLTRTLKAIEADMGRELRVAFLTTPDFKYRIGVYDKLIRDVLDYPHKVLLDRVGLPEHIRPQALSTSLGVPF